MLQINYCSHETDGKGIVLTNTTLANGDSISAGDAAALVHTYIIPFISWRWETGRGKKSTLFDLQVAGQAEPGEELPLPETVDKWHYVSLK